MMANRESDAYDHTSETAGKPNRPSPSIEHQETAGADEPQPNELRPDERRQQDGYGPRTHEQTRTTRKEGG
jgi:hypothetical protein